MFLNLESSACSFTVAAVDTPAVIGRAPECKLRVNGDEVSDRHAELACRSGQWFIRDLGSRSGTKLNGKVIAEAARLEHGDVLKIGDQSFIATVMASNSMEALGAQLAGGKLRGMIKQATAPAAPVPVKKAAVKSPSSSVRSVEPPAEKPAVAPDVPKGPRVPLPALRERRRSSPVKSFFGFLLSCAVLCGGAYGAWQLWLRYGPDAAQNPARAPGEKMLLLPPKEKATVVKTETTAEPKSANTPIATTPANPTDPAPATKAASEPKPEPATGTEPKQ
ncbi:MAG TPA: FHA domain-containing protein [Planctomycetota bacterium]|jgi:pSer/pThr/pTyr-binding forkhead associated (FHA) protein